MVTAMNLFPPAIDSLSVSPGNCSAGDTIELTAGGACRSRDTLIWEGLDGSLCVTFFCDRNGDGQPAMNEVIGDGDFGMLRRREPSGEFNTGGMMSGRYDFLARAGTDGRHSTIATVSVEIE